VRSLVRLTDELRTSAIANLVIGDAGLLVAAIRSDTPGQSVVLFALVNVVLAVIWGRFGPPGRVRRDAPRAPAPPEGSTIEPVSATRRRVLTGLVPVVGFIAILIAINPQSGAILAGVPAGVGAGELWVLGWARRFEAERGDELLRDPPASAFTAGPRAVYTRPMNDETDAT
jgi:hypothetical protein